jgi:hypothetical protein
MTLSDKLLWDEDNQYEDFIGKVVEVVNEDSNITEHFGFDRIRKFTVENEGLHELKVGSLWLISDYLEGSMEFRAHSLKDPNAWYDIEVDELGRSSKVVL